jgi:hypothetical protein
MNGALTLAWKCTGRIVLARASKIFRFTALAEKAGECKSCLNED